MDPKETVKRIRAAIMDYAEQNAKLNPEGCQDAMLEIMEANIDLLEWIDKGGFCPFHE